MKRCIALLLQLYPHTWRNRYGLELLTLMEDAGLTWRDCADVFQGAVRMRLLSARKWPVVRTLAAFTIAGALIGAVVAATLQRQYVSTAMVGFPGSLEGPHAEQTRQQFESLLSRPFLTDLIRRHSLYAREQAHQPLEQVIDTMRRSVWVSGFTKASHASLATVSFRYHDAQLAQRVTRELVIAWIAAPSNSRLLLIDEPDLPSLPVFPNVRNLVLAGCLIGLLTGILFSAFTARVYRPQPQFPA